MVHVWNWTDIFWLSFPMLFILGNWLGLTILINWIYDRPNLRADK